MRIVLFLLGSVGVGLWGLGSAGLAQVMGDEAEMVRLEARAEEAIANGDPHTAAMSMGKAALMASHLAKSQSSPSEVKFYLGVERLFRAQEHAYRALALFEQAGGQPPASVGVCNTIHLAQVSVAESQALLAEEGPEGQDAESIQKKSRLRTAAAEWVTSVGELRTDFQCPR